jgi:hypothetical protein
MIAAYGNTFIMTPIGVLASLWQSDVAQSGTSTFVENGQQMTYIWATCKLPDAQQMCQMAMIETTLNMAFPSNQSAVSVQALDQNSAVLGSVIITPPGGATLWGQFNWGQAVWGGVASALTHWDLNWATPIVFSRLQIQATGLSAGGFRIGDLFLRYQKLGYLQRFAGSG